MKENLEKVASKPRTRDLLVTQAPWPLSQCETSYFRGKKLLWFAGQNIRIESILEWNNHHLEFPIQELNSKFCLSHSIPFIQFHSVYSIPFLEMATNLETSCNSKSRDMWSLLFIGFFSIQSDNFWESEIDSCTNMDKKKSSGAGQFLLKLSQTEWNGIYSIRNAIDSIRIFGPANSKHIKINLRYFYRKLNFSF